MTAPLGFFIPVVGGLIACGMGLRTVEHPFWTVLLIFALTVPLLSAAMRRLSDAGFEEGEAVQPICFLALWVVMVVGASNGVFQAAFFVGAVAGFFTLGISTILTLFLGTIYVAFLVILPFIFVSSFGQVATSCFRPSKIPTETNGPNPHEVPQ